jgi:hypothetical protein
VCNATRERGEKERGEWNGGGTRKKEGDKERGKGRNGRKAEEGFFFYVLFVLSLHKTNKHTRW